MSTPADTISQEPVPEASGTDLERSAVADLVAVLTKALSAQQLYQENNPMHRRFLSALGSAFTDVWQHASVLRLEVEESGFRWEGEAIPVANERDNNVAFLFYRDGIRRLTFLSGFEDEVKRFLALLHRARTLDREGDDLVTLLWEEEFASFQYDYVDMLAEALEVPETGAEELDPVPAGQIADDVAEAAAGDDEDATAASRSEAAEPDGISADEFQETLYFLDDPELRELKRQVGHEWSRDLRIPLLHALFDRLEDPVPERQREVLDVLRQLLSVLLGRGELEAAALILRELEAATGPEGALLEESRSEVDRLFRDLSDPSVLGPFVESLEHGDIDPEAEELSFFFSGLRPEALPRLIRAIETSGVDRVRERLESAACALAAENTDALAELLESEDPAVASGAARVAGRLRLTEVAPRLAGLYRRGDASVRRQAVGALVALRSGPAISTVVDALDDPDRDIRIAAARGLEALQYAPARERLKSAVRSRRIRGADLSEKIAFFEAYGAVAAPDGVEVLDELLNGRRLFRGAEPSDIRACAARALGRLGSPAARAVLEEATGASDAIVRNAVASALRGERES